jgi:putative FmdB family regulatory protein
MQETGKRAGNGAIIPYNKIKRGFLRLRPTLFAYPCILSAQKVQSEGKLAMPIYDYQCSGCGKTYDVFHKVREVEEDIVCPHCNATAHVRLISAPSFSMNGKPSGSYTPAQAPSCTDGGCCGGSCGLN